MRIAYVTVEDSFDVHQWSGSLTHVRRALEHAGAVVDPVIGNLRPGLIAEVAVPMRLAWHRRFSAGRYLPPVDPILLRSYAATVEARLATSTADLIFSPGSRPVAYLRSSKPIVFWSDGTFAGMVDFYSEYTGLSSAALAAGHRAEREALDRARLALFTSEWAAQSAIEAYGADPAKVKVVPFGANLDHQRSRKDLEAILVAREARVLRLLFPAVDWERKGGDLAVAVLQRLQACGVAAELHLVGCQPPGPLPPGVIAHGFLSKREASGRQALDQLFRQAHLLLLPTRADCVPVVLAEACSYGVPCLTTAVGGIPTAVRDGRNGWALPLSAPAEAYVERILPLVQDPAAYHQLARGAFEEYEQRLNWSVAGQQVMELLQELF